MENQYHSYTPIMLAGEDAFIQWVLHGEAHDTWSVWMSTDPAFSNKVEAARQIVLSLSNADAPGLTEMEKASLWKNIEAGTKTEVAKPKGPQFRKLISWTIAAAASLALLVWFNSYTSREQVYAEAGQQKEISLPESSAVKLNAGSSVSFKEKTFESAREIHLEGEAFFNVKPGSTFTVITDQGRVTVLGTSFNVYARDGRFEVSCYTGKVKVESKDDAEKIITPGLKTTKTISGELEQSSFSAATDHPEWIDGKFTFDNQPLSEVIQELERQFDIKVNLENGIDTMKYTGLFESGDLQQALELITWPLHLQFNIKGNTVTISQ
jgi:transmembrane sensor